MRFLSLILFMSLGAGWLSAGESPLHQMSRARQTERIAADMRLVAVYRLGLSNTLAFIARQTNLFPAAKQDEPHLPRREEKEVLWQAWRSYLDYLLALDALDAHHAGWWRLSGVRRETSFAVGHAAFLAKYRFGLEFAMLAERNPFLDTVLNEPVPEHGIEDGLYARLKFRFLNVITATDFGAQVILFRTMRDGAPDSLRAAMANDAGALLRHGRGTGELLTVKNALKVVRSAGDAAWFPVQAGVSEWMSDTKVLRKDRSLITSAQVDELRLKLQPGDVMLTRREWYLSNVGLPGFWPHAALYVGTAAERRHFFADADVVAWVKARGIVGGDFERLIAVRSTAAYSRSLKPDEQGHLPRVIEAMSEGVTFTTIEHSADADSLVVLRPVLPKLEKAAAILRAFHYSGRPYDFNFDFATDAELVCTELVFKAYEPARGVRGLNLPLEEMLGRQLLPANRIARQFDEQHGTTNAQFQFVRFLDGHERAGRAVEASEAEFRASWRRPKWHVVVKKAAQ